MIEFRELTIEDFDNEQLINSIYGIDNFVSQELSIAKIKKIFECKRTTTDTFIAVDTDKNIIVGHAAVNVHYSFTGSRIGVLYDLAIAPAYRNRWLGSKLLAYARDKCGDNHLLTRMSGPVDKTMSAFYRRAGAVDTGATVYSYAYPKRQIKMM